MGTFLFIAYNNSFIHIHDGLIYNYQAAPETFFHSFSSWQKSGLNVNLIISFFNKKPGRAEPFMSVFQ